MRRPRPPRRGLYLLPTTFTLGNLFCGFFSMVAASQGRFEVAAVLVIVAGVLDGLDGRIARLTGSTSDFGFQFDSLADVVSFGVAPAFLTYSWALAPLGRLGWLAAFCYLVCAALRLARFNLQSRAGDKRFFAGLPSPPAAGATACLAFVMPLGREAAWVPVTVASLLVTFAGLMISRFRYRSFKDFDLRSRRSYLWALPIAATLVLLAIDFERTVTVLAAVYVVSAPAAYVWGLLRRGRARAADGASGEIARDEVADGPRAG